jgi:colanic acid biosynthesis glycosyl transferase WcaI
VIRDGAEIAPAGTPQPALDENVVRAIRGESRFVLLHAGNLGFYGAWDTLIAAAKELAAESVGLVFVGDGAQRAPLQARAASLANVRFLPFFSPHKIPSVLAAADVHVVTIKRGLEGIVVPSKMYGILGAGRPLLVLAPQQTDAARLCAQIGCGLCCDPASPGALLAAIRELAADPARLQAMGEAAKSAAPNYDRAVETRKFLQIVREAASA